jgi:aspartyl protease family protein
MKSRNRYQWVTLIALALAFTVQSPPAMKAQEEQPELMPRVGETLREYEARKKGLHPPSREDASSVTLAADARGHFSVEPAINGTRVRMMVDTGATLVSLTEKDARQIGIKLALSDFKARTSTANGVVPVAPVLLHEVAIGEISMRNVPAIVHPGNSLAVSLLGMSFLSKLSHFEMSGGRLILKR